MWKKILHKLSEKKAFTLVEIICSVAIFAIVLIIFMSFFVSANGLTAKSVKVNRGASKIANYLEGGTKNTEDVKKTETTGGISVTVDGTTFTGTLRQGEIYEFYDPGPPNVFTGQKLVVLQKGIFS